MFRHSTTLKCLGLGLLVTIVQVLLAVSCAQPEGSWLDRYRTLVQHDSYWFANIIDRGYGTTLPPDRAQGDGGVERRFFPGLSASHAGDQEAYAIWILMLRCCSRRSSGPGLFGLIFSSSRNAGNCRCPLQVFGDARDRGTSGGFLFRGRVFGVACFSRRLVGFIYWSTRRRAMVAGARGVAWRGDVGDADRRAALRCFSAWCTRGSRRG